MSMVEFQTGTLLVLCITSLAIVWLLWTARSDQKAVQEQTLEGVGHELRLNLQRFMAELAAITRDEPVMGGEMMRVYHPQLDAVYRQVIPANRNALAIIGATYQTIQSRKNDIVNTFNAGRDVKQDAAPAAIDALIDAIITLYLWEEHGGKRPQDAHSTRSWHVRKWMRNYGMHQDLFPGLYLRDAVVERLRQYGMTLTPKPLSMSAHEYWNKRYDRRADPRAPFWTRKAAKSDEVALAETVARPIRDGERVVVG